MSLEENLSVVRRIVNHTDLPVSADIEAGYATTAEGVARSAQAVVKTGAVGIKLEDSTGDESRPLYDVSFMVEKLKAIRASEELNHLPVITCGDENDIHFITAAIEAGATDHFTTPIEPDTVSDKLKKYAGGPED